MQCNQSFCGNGFTNGPFYSSYNAPLQCNQSMYPEIVGEGEVTSVTLPDGTIQFFFMPTVKWFPPNATQPCHPIYPSVAANPMLPNPIYNIPPYNNNVGTWFVRSISNPLPQNVFNPTCQRIEIPRPYFNSDYNMNNINNGYQVKFHNDNWTSTTDLHYFYPSLRQHDYVKTPCKGTATVQINTVPVENNRMTCHYEVVCTKPCNCNVGAKPMSLESLVEPKLATKSNNASTDDCSCADIVKKRNKKEKEEKKRRNKAKHTCVCSCDSTGKIVSVDKSVTTYTDECSSCTPADGRETQTGTKEKSKWFKKVAHKLSSGKCSPINLLKTDNKLQKCDSKEAELWQPVTPLSKRAMEIKSSENILDSSGNEFNGGCHSNCSSYSG